MPTQWRTIAGCLEGRTASQCLAHYEKLLDQAQGKDGLEDDPRRLRPGEIDPNPEVKPALPDPVDFDEDEKEMLQEARARLANTKGKKAKRKARERTLDEAKRLAALQKRRELKAAGIHMPVPSTGGKGKKRTKMIDVMAEIPFHKEAPAGFYDTSKEVALEQKLTKNPKFKAITLQRLEGERMQEVEERAKKKDNEAMKKLKQDNLPVAMAKISKKNDVRHVGERPALSLPAPQITNAELDAIAKAAARGEVGDGEEEDGGEGVTKSLMPRVEQTPAFTPMRTPLAAGSGASTVQREAQYLAAMSRETQTPLVGGAGPSMSASEFAAPARPLVTPNVLKTPMVVARTGRAAAAATPLRTPGSDALAINAGEDAGSSKRRKTQDEQGVAAVAAGEADDGTPDLFASLASLPAPKNEYRVIIPDLKQAAPADAESLVPLDAADVRNKAQQQQMTVLKDRERMQSLVLRKGLPRATNPEWAAKLSGSWSSDVQRLIAFDNAVTPLASSGKKGKRGRGSVAPDSEVPEMEVFSERELNAAREELERDAEPFDPEQFAAEWERHYASQMLVLGRGRVARAQLTRAELAAALREEHKRLTEHAQDLTLQCQKLEGKLSVMYQGYSARADALGKDVVEAAEGLARATIDAECFRSMQVQEEISIRKRIVKLESEVAIVQAREEELQKEYSSLLIQK